MQFPYNNYIHVTYNIYVITWDGDNLCSPEFACLDRLFTVNGQPPALKNGGLALSVENGGLTPGLEAEEGEEGEAYGLDADAAHDGLGLPHQVALA